MFLNNQDLWCCLVLIDYSLEGEELSADKMRSRCFVYPWFLRLLSLVRPSSVSLLWSRGSASVPYPLNVEYVEYLLVLLYVRAKNNNRTYALSTAETARERFEAKSRAQHNNGTWNQNPS